MADTKTAHPVVSVHVSFDDAPWRRAEPDTVWFESVDEALPTVGRALALGPGVSVTVWMEEPEAFDHDEDPDLDDWPAARHVRRLER